MLSLTFDKGIKNVGLWQSFLIYMLCVRSSLLMLASDKSAFTNQLLLCKAEEFVNLKTIPHRHHVTFILALL